MAVRGMMERVVLVMVVVVAVLGVWGSVSQAADSVEDRPPQYLNSFAVQVQGGMAEARAVASHLGFRVVRELPHIGVFVFEHPTLSHRAKRSADDHVATLQDHPKVLYAQQEVELKRVKREVVSDAVTGGEPVKRSIIHDKQLELPIREITDNSVFHREKLSPVAQRGLHYDMGFNDPLYSDMWYLENRGQSGGERFLDMNVQVSWASGFTGEGVVVCILDDGVDHSHPDLVGNYDAKASADLNDKTDVMNDPMPNMTNPSNGHGTRCAGEIAATANNNVCGVGVAYNARIGGIRILDGSVTDALEGEALSFNNQYVHIYSASWGPNDDGHTMEAPNFFASQALRNGVKKGRAGLGNIYVWATGNGGMNGDDCNADGYTSSIETLSVGSITDRGRQPFFMENCTSTLAVVPTGGEEYRGQESERGQIKLKVVTTDAGGGCIENFQGTSSAAPLAAGCIANVLQANPALTWRDVQHVVVHGSRLPSVDGSWTVNGAGHHVSHKFGFGLMDCGRMVQVAQGWKNVPQQHVCQYHSHGGPIKIGYGTNITDKLFVDGCKGDNSKRIQRLEHVQVKLALNTRRRGDTNIFLVSPAGTRSELLSLRGLDSMQGEWEFTFMTVHSWDEDPKGTWTLEIYDKPKPEEHSEELSVLTMALDAFDDDDQYTGGGYLKNWTLTLYGTAGERHSRDFSSRQGARSAYHPSHEALERIKRAETESAQNVQVKRASSAATKRRENKRTNLNHHSGLTVDVDDLAKRLRQVLDRGGRQGRKYEKRVVEEEEKEEEEEEVEKEEEVEEAEEEEESSAGQVTQAVGAAVRKSLSDHYKYKEERSGHSDNRLTREHLLVKILKRLERLLEDK